MVHDERASLFRTGVQTPRQTVLRILAAVVCPLSVGGVIIVVVYTLFILIYFTFCNHLILLSLISGLRLYAGGPKIIIIIIIIINVGSFSISVMVSRHLSLYVSRS